MIVCLRIWIGLLWTVSAVSGYLWAVCDLPAFSWLAVVPAFVSIFYLDILEDEKRGQS